MTADREPEPISRTGSSISVVKGETLATSNPGSLVDALRTVPGLDISESGGPGSTANIRLRGANTGQTLVMIDGIRINDPTAASGDFDFAHVCAERHRAHRGAERPAKRALWLGRDGRRRQHHHQEGYGPGAIQRPHRRRKLRHRGHQRDRWSDRQGPWSYAVTGGGQHSNGFSRYGYRIPPLEAKFGPLERDGFDRVGGSARFGYDAGEGVRLEAGMLSSFTRSAYDQSTGTFPDTPSSADKAFAAGLGTRLGRYVRRHPHAQPQRIRHPHRSLLQRCDLQDQQAAAKYHVDHFRLHRQQHRRGISGQSETWRRSVR